MVRGILKRIHVNTHRLRANARIDTPEPVITVKTWKSNHYGFRAAVLGPSTVVYRPEKPLSCGAVLWVETRAPVLIDDEILIS